MKQYNDSSSTSVILLSEEQTNMIDALCKEYEITNYVINNDGSIDVNGDVDLSNKLSTSLPLRFGKVSGNFECGYNHLTSLVGSPRVVEGTFNCINNDLTSLEGGPRVVGGNFACAHNDLTSLKHCPVKVGNHFLCGYNHLTSLEHCPKEMPNIFDCSKNKLTSLEHSPQTVGGYYNCVENIISSLKWCPTKIGGELYCNLNNFPNHFNFSYEILTSEQKETLIKYQHYYEVWSPEFSEENMQLLIGDIKDGLL